MEACLWPQVSWHFINDNHQAENERYKEIKKIKKYSQKNIRIVYYSLFVSVCMCVCVYYYYNYTIALSQILSTLQIISHFVSHKPMKWDSDNQHSYNTHIYIYIYIWESLNK